MSRKILMVANPVHPIPPLKGAAVETWMYEVSKRLVSFESHIVSISDVFYTDKEYSDGIFFHRISFGKLYKRLFQKITKLDPLSYAKRVAKIVDEVSPEIVHMHNSVKWCEPLVAHLENSGIKTIIHMHNKTKQNVNIHSDVFVGCSNYIVNLFKQGLINAERYACLYNGIDLQKFRPHWVVSHLRDDIRRRFGIGEDEFVVLFVGRVVPEKGVEHFVNSALLLQDIENIRFLVVGEISEKGHNNEYASVITKLAAPLGARIKFTGVFPPSKMHLLYLLGDIIVIPSSTEEAFSMVAIEAMATGLPTIISRTGGVPEYMIDGNNGLFIHGKEPASDIAQKIKIIMASAELKEKLGRAAVKTVEDRFSWDRIAFDTEMLYHDMLSR